MTRPLKITIICPYYFPFPGGQELHTAFLVKYLKKFKVKLTIITTNNPRMKKYEKYGNVEIFRLNPLFEIYTNPFSLKLFPLLMKIETDIFHVQGYWSLFANVAALVSKIKRIPLIYTSHGFQSSLFMKNFFFRFFVICYIKTLGLFMFNQMKMITCNHNEDKKILENIGIVRNKITILPSGLDLKKYKEIENEITPKILDSIRKKYNLKWPVLLYIGRLVKRKGCHFLLESLPDVLKKYPETKCIIIGDGPDEERFKNLASKLNIKNHTIFTGYIKPLSQSLIAFIKVADIQILPSLAESMPVSVMEGLYFGNPIIISDMYFAKWIKYKNKKLYIPIDPKNIKDISKKIIELLDDKILNNMLIINGKKFVIENFNWHNIAKCTYDLYLKSLNKYKNFPRKTQLGNLNQN